MIAIGLVAYLWVGVAAAFNFDAWCTSTGSLSDFSKLARFASVVWLVPLWGPFVVVGLVAAAFGMLPDDIDSGRGK